MNGLDQKNMTRREKDSLAMHSIVTNYRQNERKIVETLFFQHERHQGIIGGFRETVWKQLFEQIIPHKFVVEQSVFIVDSFGNVSNEVDLAIIDETYTPYIFRYGKLKFVPIEAVAAVVECKSNTMKNIKLSDWLDQIEKLKTSQLSIARMHAYFVTNESDRVDYDPDSKFPPPPRQTATRPIRILCALAKPTKVDSRFDFIISANEREKKLDITTTDPDKDLFKWYCELNHAQMDESVSIRPEEGLEGKRLSDYAVSSKSENGASESVSLLTLTFQLNQLLMLINNPILFPHLAYVKMFNFDREEMKSEDPTDRGDINRESPNISV